MRLCEISGYNIVSAVKVSVGGGGGWIFLGKEYHCSYLPQFHINSLKNIMEMSKQNLCMKFRIH